jgi:release factor glutamine methyltransferase
MNISTAIASAAEVLSNAGIPEPRREAASLLAFVLQKDPAFLIANSAYEFSTDQKKLFESCIQRRAGREPFQYIVGRQEFYGLEFEVTPDVLIPRPETEILVENAIAVLSAHEDPSFLEIGVGSGCISISMLNTLKNANAVGVDISLSALAVAVRNAEKHGVSGRFELMQGDAFPPLRGRMFDVIVSNPPYVSAGEIDDLQLEVRDHEPRTALDGGEDGLDIIARIIREAPQFLKPQGYLLLEIAHDQSAKVPDFFDTGIWQEPEFIPDLQGISRVVKAELVSPPGR